MSKQDESDRSNDPTRGSIAPGADFTLGIIQPDREYYAITLTIDTDGLLTTATDSMWVGWTKGEPRLEIRQARLANADSAKHMARTWTIIGRPHLVVNSDEQFAIYYALFGGHALVEKDVAQRHLPEAVAPHRCTLGPSGDIINLENASKDVLRRVPTPKNRMRLLKRDQFRCRVCGRRPDDHLDLELHIHHIREWAHGGITDDWNLITLCNTCHRGLDPHHEPELYPLIGQAITTDISEYDREYWEGVLRYRSVRAKQMRELDQGVLSGKAQVKKGKTGKGARKR